jgi:hypothetical protein
MSTELTWFKSSYSDTEGGDCVEVATCPSTIYIRDSKHDMGPILSVSPTRWTAFVRYASAPAPPR